MKKIIPDTLIQLHARKNFVISVKCALKLIPFYLDACTDKITYAIANYFADKD